VEAIYWLTRQQEEVEMASGAASTEARLVHHELANRYGDKANQAEADTLACLGIEQVPANQYWVNGFRYTNASDAIAEARRPAVQ
jgi:hypothetical protein